MRRPHPVVVVPGIGGSGPDHWQTSWQADLPGAVRFAPASWDRPDRDDWLRALQEAVAGCAAPPVLLAHSLGCLVSADLARADPASVAGVVLVAPPDPHGDAFPAAAASFRPLDPRPIGVRALLVASRDDPYGTPSFAAATATAWGAALVDAGAVGHINDESGVGRWAAGRALFEEFVDAVG